MLAELAIVLAIQCFKIVSIIALVGLHIEDVEFSNNGFGLYSILGPLVLGFVSILLTFGPHTHTHLLIHICFLTPAAYQADRPVSCKCEGITNIKLH